MFFCEIRFLVGITEPWLRRVYRLARLPIRREVRQVARVAGFRVVRVVPDRVLLAAVVRRRRLAVVLLG